MGDPFNPLHPLTNPLHPLIVPLFTPAELAVGLGLRANPISRLWQGNSPLRFIRTTSTPLSEAYAWILRPRHKAGLGDFFQC